MPLTERLAHELRQYREQESGHSALSLFNGPRGGVLRRSNFTRRIWKPALDTAGLSDTLRFHDLRHCYATWLITDGVPVNVVQKVLGHARASTTLNRYTHTPEDHFDYIRKSLNESHC